MQFIWDDDKNESNIEKHGFDFNDAKEVLEGQILEILDTRNDYGELRWIAFGLLKFDVVVVVYVERNAETIRIISMREALPHEQDRYFESIAH